MIKWIFFFNDFFKWNHDEFPAFKMWMRNGQFIRFDMLIIIKNNILIFNIYIFNFYFNIFLLVFLSVINYIFFYIFVSLDLLSLTKGR